jgi:hypothetical protein
MDCPRRQRRNNGQRLGYYTGIMASQNDQRGGGGRGESIFTEDESPPYFSAAFIAFDVN